MSQEIIEKLKVQIIETLNLEDLEPGDIGAEDPLFGDDGIGLDSIDALELIVLMNQEYNILTRQTICFNCWIASS